ncbi:hypothetical protein [Photobacterium rosenbergii]|uniref:hypothetical protein n=1 Tax=Photobacterium rosenbergii TaxID=294936 RepID=UPI001C994037|nr:hypothetical protein [Photobacterium rosenbergii]MBY5948782.1 hypothetical protein [Photobacterium rosenbergii]
MHWKERYKDCLNSAGQIARKVPPEKVLEILNYRLKLDERTVRIVEYGGRVSTRNTLFACCIKGCGYEWISTASDVVQNGRGCLRCSGNEPVSQTFIQEKLNDNGRQIELLDYSGSTQKTSTFRCLIDGCNYQWKTSVNHVLNNGTGCPRCNGKAPLTKEYIQKKLDQDSRNIDILSYAGSAKGASKFKCTIPDCGYEWEASSDSVVRGNGCARCSKVERWTLDTIQQHLDHHDRNITILKYAGNIDVQSSFRCDVDGCGYGSDREWRTGAYHILNGKGCPRCLGVERYTEQQLHEKLKELKFPIKLVEYSGNGDYGSKFECLVEGCGFGVDVPWVTGTYHILRGGKCPRCLGMEKHSKESIQKILNENARNINVVSFGSSMNDRETSFKCMKNDCGYEWKTTANSVVSRNTGCPICASSTTDNDMLYLFEDTQGAYKIGIGSWEDGIARIKVQLRKRKNANIPLPKKIHRVVRVDDALKYEKHILSKYEVNPYFTKQPFDGKTECRVFTSEELREVLAYIDSKALEVMCIDGDILNTTVLLD